MKSFLFVLCFMPSLLLAQGELTKKLSRIESDTEKFAFFYNENMDVEQVRYYSRFKPTDKWHVAEVINYKYDDEGKLSEQFFSKISGGVPTPDFKIVTEKVEGEPDICTTYQWSPSTNRWKGQSRNQRVNRYSDAFRYWDWDTYKNEWKPEVKEVEYSSNSVTVTTEETRGSTKTKTATTMLGVNRSEAQILEERKIETRTDVTIETHTAYDKIWQKRISQERTVTYPSGHSNTESSSWDYDSFGLEYEWPSLLQAIRNVAITGPSYTHNGNYYYYCPELGQSLLVFHHFSGVYYTEVSEPYGSLSYLYTCDVEINGRGEPIVYLGEQVGTYTNDLGTLDYIDNSSVQIGYVRVMERESTEIVDGQEYIARFMATIDSYSNVRWIRSFWNGGMYPAMIQRFEGMPGEGMDYLDRENLTEFDKDFYVTYFDEKGRIVGIRAPKEDGTQHSTVFGYDEWGVRNFEGSWRPGYPASFGGTIYVAQLNGKKGLIETVSQHSSWDGYWYGANFVGEEKFDWDETLQQWVDKTNVTCYDLSDYGRTKTMQTKFEMTKDEQSQCANYKLYDSEGAIVVNCDYEYLADLDFYTQLAGNRNDFWRDFVNDYIYEDDGSGRRFQKAFSWNCYDYYSHRYHVSFQQPPKKIGSFSFYYDDPLPNPVQDVNVDGHISSQDIVALVRRYKLGEIEEDDLKNRVSEIVDIILQLKKSE